MRNANLSNRVMIADDDIFLQKIFTSAFEGVADVIAVGDGANVLAAYLEHSPDILFLDIHLPHISGSELLEKIVAVDSDAYIVMLSADSDKKNIMSSHYFGAKDFLTKPFEKARLRRAFYACPTIGLAS